MKITKVKCHVIVDPGYDVSATSSAQDDIVVEVFTDEGVAGIGESDVNPWIARACIEAPGTHTMDRGLGEVLVGLDPTDPPRVWQEVYRSTAMAGRRGALVHALGAVDIALWDICGKVAGVPVWKLLGGGSSEPGEHLNAYCSLEPEVGDLDSYVESMVRWARRAVELGFDAVKAEATFSGPYANMGLRLPDSAMTEVLKAVRAAVGPSVTLMVDVQYAFDSVQRALASFEDWVDFDLRFVETPLWIDDIEGYAELAAASPIPIAAGEWQATAFEFRELVAAGCLDVLQPDVGRVGGLSEAVKVCDLAAATGRVVIPHAWKTGITLAATAHLAAARPEVERFEFLHPETCESRLRKELTLDEVQVTPHGVTIPRAPGLGVELNRDALAEFERAARDLYDA
ncbi:MAG: mandelate racemase/muconate lactonizing enzyme family protein [Actinomycetota bacterium]|nr:mandelate racemase/muconate lactonizing enzyme family protein [Actinomycetota bacterium]